MNEIIEKELNIEDMIYEIRGKQVMLDSDLAYLFDYETKDLNRNVKNNMKRFPINYCFQLTDEEYSNLRCKNFTSSLKNNYGGRRYNPYVFTEHGITMLAGILKSEKAIKMSLKIVDTFIRMRHFIKDNMLTQQNINNIVLEDHTHILKMDDDLKLLQEAFDKLEDKKRVNEIYLDGEFYKAFSRVIDIFNEAKKELIIIDSYADKKLLDIIKDLNIKVTIITKEKGKLNKTIIDEYNKEFNNLKVIYNDSFHDRYFIIDRNIIYHSGTSINYMGSKTFNINLIQDKYVFDLLIKKITQIICQ
ncbi:MAG: ORF6N domain-containing protein [Bacilli bacterium]|nr:ORF6N domain-containing protein [Bacilli bacterium]